MHYIDPEKTTVTGKGGNDVADSDYTAESGSKGAKTGDSTDLLMWLAMILAATLALTGTAAYRRKRRNL